MLNHGYIAQTLRRPLATKDGGTLRVADASDKRLPEIARACLAALGAQLRTQILEFDRMINAWHRSNETSKRLDEILASVQRWATALVASVADPRAFRSGRDFSAWIGLVPKHGGGAGRAAAGGGGAGRAAAGGGGAGRAAAGGGGAGRAAAGGGGAGFAAGGGGAGFAAGGAGLPGLAGAGFVSSFPGWACATTIPDAHSACAG